MGLLRKVLASTVGQKFVLAITGLGLCGFLVVHLAGNLLLYVGADAYNHYAHTLHQQEWLIKIAEVGLVTLFAAHIYLALTCTSQNNVARPRGYARVESKRDSQIVATMWTPNRWMFTTGAIVLGFVLLHVSEFTLGLRLAATDPHEAPYAKALRILSNPLSCAVYIGGSLMLGVHLSHGVQSALQTLGLMPRWSYNSVGWVSVLFAAIIALGFASFPVWAFFTTAAGR